MLEAEILTPKDLEIEINEPKILEMEILRPKNLEMEIMTSENLEMELQETDELELELTGQVSTQTSDNDYLNAKNKPKINNVELIGNKTLDELGIQAKGDYATKNEIPIIPQTRISQLVIDGVKYLKIDWDNNEPFIRYLNTGMASLYLYKYTKTGRKKYRIGDEEVIHTSVKKWVHPANGFYERGNYQCWGIRSFQANSDFTENYDIDEIIDNAEYPIANGGYVQTEYQLDVGQTSVLIPLNDIISPILKVAETGASAVQLPYEGDGREVKLMGVKQNKNKARCNQPIKFCLFGGTGRTGYLGSCLNVATIQLFKYRLAPDNDDMHGYDTRYNVLPDVGYSVYIK